MRTYYLLTKPGIILGNLITTAGGFALASKGSFDFALFFFLLLGLGPVIASACVFNNYIDRASDAKMARTQNRPLATGALAPWRALLFATLLGTFGIAILALFTNAIAAWAAGAGFFVYVVLYSLLKTKTSLATLIGSVSGAIPPVVGYAAVSRTLDAGAFFLFAILVLWQMPHFFAIAIYRIEDYTAASIPVLPVSKGAYAAKVQMLLYCIAFAAIALLLPIYGYAGALFGLAAFVLGGAWIWLAVQGFSAENDRLWARGMFRLSLFIITTLCALMAVP